ncbi:pyridoxal 4-dehydrogenase [Paraburkholderia fungorum]|uniref:Pyridoxal 4-dehydrogenase n=2 Tax=Paraburkholderia fungorum TaxID=134537 RepID=A0A420GY74_9BURK|nr:pyridoxal 4-dehydrogenase [Paraburkholderia fungorum]
MHTRSPFSSRDRNEVRIGLGCAGIGGLFSDVDNAQALATIEAAWQQGIRYFDTAPFYGFTKSERRVGMALCEHHPDEFVLSTKVGRLLRPMSPASLHGTQSQWTNPPPFMPVFDYTYSGIMRSFEDSLQRLGISQIDVLFIHDIGFATHGALHEHYWAQLGEGGFRALDELRSAGVVRAIGAGVNEGRVVIDLMRVFDLDCTLLAGRYTLLDQSALDAVFPECLKRNVDIVLGGVFNSGILARGASGQASENQAPERLTFNYSTAPASIVHRAAKIEQVCSEYGVSLRAAAIQFAGAHTAVKTLLLGARSPEEVQQGMEAFREPVERGLWQALVDEGLLRTDAPLPSDRQLIANVTLEN